MLSSEIQEKVLKELLKRKSNISCADCTAISPTWASLDFGVFVCTNCSGPHRGLGPTITRIKSTKLDTWNQDWVACMQVGNLQLNQFWEGAMDSVSSNARKPTSGASQDEIKKFVIDKYIRKRFVPKGAEKADPKTFYKNSNIQSERNTLSNNEKKVETSFQNRNHTANIITVVQKTTQKQSLEHKDLLFSQENPQQQIQNPRIPQQTQDEEFGSYTDTGTGSIATANTAENNSQSHTTPTAQSSTSSLSFDQMMKTNNQILQEQRKRHQMQFQMNLNMNLQYSQQHSYQFSQHPFLQISGVNYHHNHHGNHYPIHNPLHSHNYFQPNLHKTHSLGGHAHEFEKNVGFQGIYGNLKENGTKEEESWSGWH